MSDTDYTPKAFQRNVEKAFAPVVDAMKSVQSKIGVPDAARDFVKRSAEMATDRASDIHTGAAKATEVMENAASKTVSGMAQLSRDVQAAAYDDAKAYLASVAKIADAKSMGEAMQIQMDYLRERGEVTMGRAKSLLDYVTGSLADGAKKAGETATKIANYTKAA